MQKSRAGASTKRLWGEMSDWSVLRRRDRLRASDGVFRLLAADHGLTFGEVPGADDPLLLGDLISACGASGVVCNAGIPPLVRLGAEVGLVLQTTGGIVGGDKKRPMWKPKHLARHGADAVALDLRLDDEPESASASLQVAARIISLAHEEGLPTLLMVTSFTKQQRDRPLLSSVRTAAELGADIIKIGLTDDNIPPKSEYVEIADRLRRYPPVLLAGGSVGRDIVVVARDAQLLGFSGYCIGRQFFASESPKDLAAQLFNLPRGEANA